MYTTNVLYKLPYVHSACVCICCVAVIMILSACRDHWMRGESQSSIESTPTVVEWVEPAVEWVEIVARINMIQVHQYQVLPNPNLRHRPQVQVEQQRAQRVVRMETKHPIPVQQHQRQSQVTIPPWITLGEEWSSGEELRKRLCDSKSWSSSSNSSRNGSKRRRSGEKNESSSKRNGNNSEVDRSSKKTRSSSKMNMDGSKGTRSGRKH